MSLVDLRVLVNTVRWAIFGQTPFDIDLLLLYSIILQYGLRDAANFLVPCAEVEISVAGFIQAQKMCVHKDLLKEPLFDDLPDVAVKLLGCKLHNGLAGLAKLTFVIRSRRRRSRGRRGGGTLLAPNQ